MAVAAHTIRDFANPPVIETVLSVQFSPLSKFSIPHSGLYWQRVRDRFPRIELRPPVAHVKEEFGSREASVASQFSIELVPAVGLQVRCWFLDQKGNKFVQVQNDRFIYNWQKVTGNETYPRYETVRSNFREEWERFREFLKDENLGVPEVDQCEVTYVNHIEYGKGWKSFGELNKVISAWSGKYSGEFLPSPEKVNTNVTYRLPDGKGRLHIALGPVIRARDAKEVLQLNLTARGAPASSETEDIIEWLNLGRKWIVEGFTDLTTDEMHRIWGRTK